MAKRKATPVESEEHASLNRIAEAVRWVVAAERDLEIIRDRCTDARANLKQAQANLRRLAISETTDYPLLAARPRTEDDSADDTGHDAGEHSAGNGEWEESEPDAPDDDYTQDIGDDL